MFREDAELELLRIPNRDEAGSTDGVETVVVQITLRPATAADVVPVVELVESAYRGEASRAGWTTEESLLGGQRTDAESIEAMVSSPDNRLVLAVGPDDEIAGCCSIERRSAGVAYFGTFAVRPTMQGSGLGNQLLAEAERIAVDEWGCELVEMTVILQREDLIGWYERRGYAKTGEQRPFPYGDERFGVPKRDDLVFVVLAKPVG